VDGSTSLGVCSMISSSGYREYNNMNNGKSNKNLINYKETDKLTVDMTGMVASSLVSSIVGTIGTVKGSASTTSWFGMTSSISGIGIDEVISSCSISGPNSMLAMSSSLFFKISSSFSFSSLSSLCISFSFSCWSCALFSSSTFFSISFFFFFLLS
jgi:hypothetical protein